MMQAEEEQRGGTLMSPKVSQFDQAVYAVVCRIPKGRVSTYGRVAAMAGYPGAARAVGNALHRNPAEGVIPCHRVVNAAGFASGSFAFGGPEEQLRRLSAEQVIADETGRVDMKTYGWPEDW